MKRKRFTPRNLEKHLATFGGKCRMCQIEISATSGLEWDHRIPLALGGEDTLENLEPLCVRCHRTKTSKVDVPAIAKSARTRQGNLGIKDLTRRRIPSPPKEPKPPGKALPPRRNLYSEAS